MEEHSDQQQNRVVGSSGPKASSAKFQQKVPLLLHLLRNVRKPVGLSGSLTEQAAAIEALQAEQPFFHSVSVLGTDQEASLPSVLGLLFHLLEISEQEVVSADPEQLLTRYLTILDKKNQLIVLLVKSADALALEQREQLIALAESHPALRLIFMQSSSSQPQTGEMNGRLQLFSLSETAALLSPEAGSRKFKVIGSIVALLLVLVTSVAFLSFEKGANRVLPKVDELDELELLPIVDLPADEKVEPSLVDQSPLIAPKAVVIEANKIAPEEPLKEGAELAPSPQVVPPKRDKVSEEKVVPLDAMPITAVVTEQLEKRQEEAIKPPKKVEKETKPLKVEAEKISIKEVSLVTTSVAIKKRELLTAGINREKWLLNRHKENFTLQIMGSGEEASIIRYIRKQRSQGRFSYYHVVKKGKHWYPLLYGVYPSKEAAKVASKKLPKALQKFKPWARSFDAIQMEIHQVATTR